MPPGIQGPRTFCQMSSYTSEKKQISSLVKSLPFNTKVTDSRVIAVLRHHPGWRDDLEVFKKYNQWGGYKLQSSRGFTISVEAALNAKWGRAKKRNEPLTEASILEQLSEYL